MAAASKRKVRRHLDRDQEEEEDPSVEPLRINPNKKILRARRRNTGGFSGGQATAQTYTKEQALKGLNASFLKALTQAYEHNNIYDLSKVFHQYTGYRAEIESNENNQSKGPEVFQSSVDLKSFLKDLGTGQDTTQNNTKGEPMHNLSNSSIFKNSSISGLSSFNPVSNYSFGSSLNLEDNATGNTSKHPMDSTESNTNKTNVSQTSMNTITKPDLDNTQKSIHSQDNHSIGSISNGPADSTTTVTKEKTPPHTPLKEVEKQPIHHTHHTPNTQKTSNTQKTPNSPKRSSTSNDSSVSKKSSIPNTPHSSKREKDHKHKSEHKDKKDSDTPENHQKTHQKPKDNHSQSTKKNEELFNLSCKVFLRKGTKFADLGFYTVEVKEKDHKKTLLIHKENSKLLSIDINHSSISSNPNPKEVTVIDTATKNIYKIKPSTNDASSALKSACGIE
ncbi:hypothetical protein NEOKW01_2082 [Nematocida sp. AWRm80]|nr:hypothetical protein NEOKW01_2082 [Nematocida sp. AWRm80]